MKCFANDYENSLGWTCSYALHDTCMMHEVKN